MQLEFHIIYNWLYSWNWIKLNQIESNSIQLEWESVVSLGDSHPFLEQPLKTVTENKKGTEIILDSCFIQLALLAR